MYWKPSHALTPVTQCARVLIFPRKAPPAVWPLNAPNGLRAMCDAQRRPAEVTETPPHIQQLWHRCTIVLNNCRTFAHVSSASRRALTMSRNEITSPPDRWKIWFNLKQIIDWNIRGQRCSRAMQFRGWSGLYRSTTKRRTYIMGFRVCTFEMYLFEDKPPVLAEHNKHIESSRASKSALRTEYTRVYSECAQAYVHQVKIVLWCSNTGPC